MVIYKLDRLSLSFEKFILFSKVCCSAIVLLVFCLEFDTACLIDLEIINLLFFSLCWGCTLITIVIARLKLRLLELLSVCEVSIVERLHAASTQVEQHLFLGFF